MDTPRKRLDGAALREEMERSNALRALLLRYALAHHRQVVRTAACNGRHQVEQRLARWLFMAHDRAGSDAFEMTHEFLSMMLGVRRAAVTVAAGMLQKAGLIHYARGHMVVSDRAGLEAAPCECYEAARHEFERLLPTRPGDRP